MKMKNMAASPLEKSALFVTTLTAFMAPFMISSVNVALPAIQAEFKVDAVLLGWLATSYLLATAILLVPAGKIADIYGRKKVFITGVITYTVSSIAAAFTPDIIWLLAMRFGQGFGAAMFITTGVAILTSVFPPQKRGKAMGILVAAVYIGLATGPFAGGMMIQFFGWRSIFAVMLLFGGGSLFAAVRYLKGEWAEARGESLDLFGSLLYALAISLLVYGGTRLPDKNAVILFAGGLGGIIFFFQHQSRVANPVFNVRLFQQNRIFLFSSLAALINYAATFGVTFQISLYLQYIQGMSPQTAGTILMAQPVVMALLSPPAGKLSDRIEPRILASAGMAITALGLGVFAFLDNSTPIWLITGNLVLLGFGFALFSSPNMSAIMGAVEKRHYGLASGAVATMRLLGQMSSMTIATILLSVYIGRAEIQPANLDLFLKSMQSCFIIFMVLCVLGIWFSLCRGKVREGKDE